MKSIKIAVIVGLLLVVPFSQASLKPQAAKPPVVTQARIFPLEGTQFGDPFPGLTLEEEGQFRGGKAEFERAHIPEDGLGPNFNQISCVACHSVPTTGGALVDKRDLVVRIGREKNGKFDPLLDFGGQVLSRQSITTFGLISSCRQPGNDIPAEAQFVSFRAGQSLYGLGLIDAITDETILANADPSDSNRDGISGRANFVISKSSQFQDRRIGRLGWKAQMTSLKDFCGDSYLVEIGITNPDFPRERMPNGREVKCDPVADPEDDGRVVQAFVDYITFLAPPPTKPLDSEAKLGQQFFSNIGCTKCHIPVMRTSSNPDASPVLASRDVPLYSDLLLHDMGDDLADGIEQPDAQFIAAGQKPARGNEWRTQPLWGVAAKKFLLHDGRTTDLTTAIILHGGEAATARNQFLKLRGRDREALIKFLKSL